MSDKPVLISDEDEEVLLDFPTYVWTEAWDALTRDPRQKTIKIEYDMRVVAQLTQPYFKQMGVGDLVLAWKMVMSKHNTPFVFANTKLDLTKLLWVVWAEVVPERFDRSGRHEKGGF